MSKKLIIHIGYPKTATTSLQNNLFSEFHKAGLIEYLNHLNYHLVENEMGDFYIKNILQNFLSSKKISNNIVCRELQELKKIKREVSVISAETLASLYPDFTYSNINSEAKRNAKILNDIFSSYFDSIEVIIGIRAQQTVLRSCYKQWYHLITGENPKLNKIENWIDFNNYENKDNLGFDYYLLINEYINQFGLKSTHVLIYEDLIYNKEFYYQQLADIFNVKTSFISTHFEKIKQNSSVLKKEGIETDKATVGQIITKPFRHIFKKNLGNKGFRSLKKLYNILMPKDILNKRVSKKMVIRELTASEKKILMDKYCKSNLQLIERVGLNRSKMKRYGYIS